jgi:anthranilate synthase/aminodeoxychorismate synthase-like glutamine amidotransferase
MILLIDNYDSFTYNIFQQIETLGYNVHIAKHDEIDIRAIKKINPSHIVISPGPKSPKDSGVSMDVIQEFYKNIPILGVCLGHQCIGEVFGSKTIRSTKIVHGKAGLVTHVGAGLFDGVPNPFQAARYHSLMVNELPSGFIKTAWSDDGTIMAMQHKEYPLFGVQFHPESFMTEYGNEIMRNFLSWQ